jgi:hypothetical protein
LWVKGGNTRREYNKSSLHYLSKRTNCCAAAKSPFVPNTADQSHATHGELLGGRLRSCGDDPGPVHRIRAEQSGPARELLFARGRILAIRLCSTTAKVVR